MRYLLGLGSNLGNRVEHLSRGLMLLTKELHEIVYSDIYESVAIKPAGAPEDWNKNYLNMCVSGFSQIDPFNLMKYLQDIEQSSGIIRSLVRWSPRELDIDILLAGTLVIDKEFIKIPHPGLLERDFALLPALQVWPNAFHPIQKKFLHECNYNIDTNLRIYGH